MNSQDIIRKHHQDMTELVELYRGFPIDEVDIGAIQDAAWHLRGHVTRSNDEPVAD